LGLGLGLGWGLGFGSRVRVRVRAVQPVDLNLAAGQAVWRRLEFRRHLRGLVKG
jgi:hypothetical protein